MKLDKERYISDCQDWQTSDDFIEALLEAIGISQFDFDTCCTEFNIPAEIYITEEGTYNRCNKKLNDNDGLKANWPKGIGWMNPPYGRPDLQNFVKKISEQTAHNSQTSIVALLPQRFENEYYHSNVLTMASGIYLLRGKKLCFSLPGGYTLDKKNPVAPQKLCLAFFNFEEEKLLDISEKLNKTRYKGIMISPKILEYDEIPF